MMQTKTVRVTCDPHAMLGYLGSSFHNGSTCALELVQNAERAGARRIKITSEAKSFVIEDDGQGIGDFQSLFSLARSGWSDEIRRTRHPFGVGFAAAIHACDQLVIESGDQYLVATTSELMSLNEVEVCQAAQFVHGSKIALRGLKTQVDEKWIASRLAGFNLPIEWNGAELPRPDAYMAAEGWIDTPIGKLLVRPDRGLLRRERGPQTYLHGVSIGGVRDAEFPQSVLHLDAAEFRGQPPDRHTLVDSVAQQRRIDKHFADGIRAFLAMEKQKLDGREFVARHAVDCRTWDCTELLSDLPWIPGYWVGRFTSLPVIARYMGDDDGFTLLSNDPVAASDVPAEILPARFGSLEEGESVEAMFAFASQMAVMWADVDSLADAGHWLAKRVVNTDAVPEVRYDSDAQIHHDIDVDRWRGAVVVTNSLRLAFEGQEVQVTAAGCVTGGVLYLSPDPDVDVIRHLTDFQEDEHYEDLIHEEWKGRFCRLLNMWKGVPPASVIESVLEKVRYEIPDAYHGLEFRLAIGKDGRLNVSAQ